MTTQLTHQVLATFRTLESTRLAALALQARGIAAARIAHCGATALTIETTADQRELVRGILLDNGATDAAVTENARRASWFSHQGSPFEKNGPITGTGVEPGAGDSEAGLSEHFEE